MNNTVHTEQAMQTLSYLFLVFKIKTFLQFIYTYYVQSPKQTLERRKLVMFMEHKAQKNFKI